jgi:hypothetical protein
MVTEIPFDRDTGITPFDAGIGEDRNHAGHVGDFTKQLLRILRRIGLGNHKGWHSRFEAEKPGTHLASIVVVQSCQVIRQRRHNARFALARQSREWFRAAPFQTASEPSMNVAVGRGNKGSGAQNMLELRHQHPVAKARYGVQKYVGSGAKHKTDIP